MDIKKLSSAFAFSLLVAAAPAVFAHDRGEFGAEFSRYDRNGDGVISRSEFPLDDALFTRLDQNRDGVISRNEAQAAMGDRGWQRDELSRLDRNHDGVISRDEWNGDAATFDRLDRNRDGVLSQADRRTTTRTNRNSRFRGMDTNRDGRITRDEWRGNDNSFRQHDRNGDGVISGKEMHGKTAKEKKRGR